jgi:hypothetical protein
MSDPAAAIPDWMRWSFRGQCAVAIDGLVLFSPLIGINVEGYCGDGSFEPFTDLPRWREIATILAEEHGTEPARLIAAIEVAIKHRSDQLLLDALGGRAVPCSKPASSPSTSSSRSGPPKLIISKAALRGRAPCHLRCQPG